MIYLEIVPPTAILNDIQQAAQRSPTLMATAYKRSTQRLAQRWKTALGVEPPPAAQFYPIRWKSERQRRAYFATNGFGHGIPSTRSHQLARDWKVTVETVDNGGSIIVANANDAAGYVYGDDVNEVVRQPMFDGSLGGIPWLNPTEVNFKYADEAETVLEETWFTVSDPTAGVR